MLRVQDRVLSEGTARVGEASAYIGTLSQSDFTLIDVGASGGVGEIWKPLGSRLTGFAFDPNRVACDELNSRGERVRYIAARISGPPRSTHEYDHWSTYPSGRLFIEAVLAGQHKTMEEYYTPGGTDFVAGHESRVPDVAPAQQLSFHRAGERPKDSFTLDEFAVKERVDNVDFIKTDTDGVDFDVLRGAERLLFDGSVLGVQVEANFAGSPHPLTNTFANIDIFMRQHGFTLFKIPELNVYAKASLPGRFVHPFPSQGYFGQLIWADAVYLRDVCRPGYFGAWPINFDLQKALNLLALFDLYDLPDCGAELALSFADAFRAHGIDVTPLTAMFTKRAAAIEAAAGI